MLGKMKRLGAEAFNGGLAKPERNGYRCTVYNTLACARVPVDARATYTTFFASQVYVNVKFVKNVYV